MGQLPRRTGVAVCVLVTLCAFLASSSNRAYGQETLLPVENVAGQTSPEGAMAPAGPAVVADPALPPPTNPALDLRTPAPEQPSIFHRWWFWTAVGAAAAATVIIVVASSRGHAPPATDLGNQEFRP
jgi:hypothetical protein